MQWTSEQKPGAREMKRDDCRRCMLLQFAEAGETVGSSKEEITCRVKSKDWTLR